MRLTIIAALFFGTFPVYTAFVYVTQVKLYEAAILPCVKPCSGVVQWACATSKEVVALCDQRTCKNERGYELSHEKILIGNLSLKIASADFSKKGWYTCACNSRDICTVSLRIESPTLQIHIKPSEPLVLELPVREPVEVIYNSTSAAGPSCNQICTVDGRSLRCKEKYKERTLLVCAVQLREVMPPDHGVYIIKDTKNDEIVSTYTVTVQDEQPLPDGCRCSKHTGALVVVVMALVVVLFGAGTTIVFQKREIQRLQTLT